jgi:hypothetical protein
VVGDLAAAIDLQHRDVARGQHVLGPAGLAEGEHRRVLDQPELVGLWPVAAVGEGLHGAPDRRVGLAAEAADDPAGPLGVDRRGYSVHLTAGSARSATWAASYSARLAASKAMATAM